ncbi:MAG: GNAT family N-acetyltransferase [Nanoarchaeota archaeon]
MITIRKAKLSDVDDLVSMNTTFIKEHGAMIVARQPLAKEWVQKKKEAPQLWRRWITRNTRSRNARVHLAYVDGKLAGFNLCIIKKNIPGFTLEKYGEVMDLYVKKSFRGRGVSTALKDTAMAWFKERGMKHASIHAHHENSHARDIYRKWGFIDYHVEKRMKIR